MLKVDIYLKSGQTLTIKCQTISFQYNNATLEYEGYEYKGLSSHKKVSLVPGYIAAYTVEEVD